MSTKPVIVWFRHDLRTADHPALTNAAKSGAPVLPLYVLDETTPGRWKPGGASRWWLHQSLAAHGRRLASLGGPLILRRGPASDVVSQVAREAGAGAVYCTRCYEPWAASLEAELEKRLAKDGIAFKRFSGVLLKEPEDVKTKSGEPFRVFTPFWRAFGATAPSRPLPVPPRLEAADVEIASDALEDWNLLPSKPDWASGLREAWHPGEEGAEAQLSAFLDDNLAAYAENRDRPDLAGTSRLSPHLHHGEISPNAVWHAATAAAASQRGAERGLGAFLRELAWREFSYHLLHHNPALPQEPFRPEFAGFPWAEDHQGLADWQRGTTGYPIVDAGMRQLWHTGWMHNRVRMIVASFLIKDLLVPWQVGAAWFWDTLVDADLANNSASWQWVAGCGADAAPYFRIFNPVKQGEKFDPDGNYVRRWVPELENLPAPAVHAPWQAPTDVLAKAGVMLGKTYSPPIVDHAAAREKALAAYARMKASDGT